MVFVQGRVIGEVVLWCEFGETELEDKLGRSRGDGLEVVKVYLIWLGT